MYQSYQQFKHDLCPVVSPVDILPAPNPLYQQQIQQLQNLLAQKDAHLDSLGHR